MLKEGDIMGKLLYLFKGDQQMKKEIEILDIAKTFLSLESMTHKKLQKLCYYAQAWHLALQDKPLVDAMFEACIHGPVCPELYRYYSGSGWQNIDREPVPEIIRSNEDVYEFIKQIHRIYGGLDGNQLEELTHQEEPWKQARRELSPWQASNNPIDEDIMKSFYLAEYERSQND